jgi:hypothetical protein
MAKQTFTVGQVLTAAQLTSLQQTAMLGGAASAKTASYTLVAADAGTTISMTSTSATTVTVNTGLFAAGDTVFIQNLGTGNLTITAGTATVATAGSLILPQNDAGILYFVSTSSSVFYDFIQVGAASPLTTKGDLYTFSTSDTRLGVGANGTVLTAASGQATGLEWATPASGGMTLLSTTTLSGATTTISGISGAYAKLYLIISGVTNATANGQFRCAPNGSTNITSQLRVDQGGSPIPTISTPTDYLFLTNSYTVLRTNSNNIFTIDINNYASATAYKSFRVNGLYNDVGGTNVAVNSGGGIGTNSAITSLVFSNAGGNLSTGTVLIYGVN